MLSRGLHSFESNTALWSYRVVPVHLQEPTTDSAFLF